MKILFIDFTCVVPYSDKSLDKKTIIAGTERTVIYVAEELAKEHEIYVAQHCRTDAELSRNQVQYINFDSARSLIGDKQPNIVIIIRDYKRLDEFASLYSRAKIFLWMHTIPNAKIISYRKILARYNCTILCVSKFHKQVITQMLHGHWYNNLFNVFSPRRTFDIRVIYNPIPNNLMPDNTPINKNKLIFCSSPNKGIGETILNFNKVTEVLPDMVLYIANPGYMALKGYKHLDEKLLNNPKIVVLGHLKQQELLQHVREAFCVFCPQTYKPETFGLVYAEANAVGTPVLAYDFGAAKEVLNGEEQVVDIKRSDIVIKRLSDWYQYGRPKVDGKDIFRLSNVIKAWNNLLNEFY